MQRSLVGSEMCIRDRSTRRIFSKRCNRSMHGAGVGQTSIAMQEIVPSLSYPDSRLDSNKASVKHRDKILVRPSRGAQLKLSLLNEYAFPHVCRRKAHRLPLAPEILNALFVNVLCLNSCARRFFLDFHGLARGIACMRLCIENCYKSKHIESACWRPIG